VTAVPTLPPSPKFIKLSQLNTEHLST